MSDNEIIKGDDNEKSKKYGNFSFHWVKYFSCWIFIWFIMYKLQIIKYSPILIYYLIIPYIIYSFIHKLYYVFNYPEIKVNIKICIINILCILILDLLPIFFLEKKITIETVIASVIIIVTYILFMYYKFNYNIYDIINLYVMNEDLYRASMNFNYIHFVKSILNI